jgi:hypothetical protein
MRKSAGLAATPDAARADTFYLIAAPRVAPLARADTHPCQTEQRAGDRRGDRRGGAGKGSPGGAQDRNTSQIHTATGRNAFLKTRRLAEKPTSLIINSHGPLSKRATARSALRPGNRSVSDIAGATWQRQDWVSDFVRTGVLDKIQGEM